MTKLLAAVDNSTAALPVVGTACAVADVFGAKVEAVHVVEDGDDIARAAADAALIPFWRIGGEPSRELLAAADDPDVLFLALASRDLGGPDVPVGSVTRRLITRAPRGVVVVPPGQDAPGRIDRVLAAIDCDLATTDALSSVLGSIAESGVDIVVVHVCDAEEISPFADQVQHETEAWSEEFVSRYCPLRRDQIRLELRYGDPASEVSAVAARVAADLVVLAWSQSFDRGHGAVVRRLLAQDRIPVLLVPTGLAPDDDG